ncbi:MAG: hypothetical protein AMXMBFR34_32220 [Myxococcaceae bacterium]
MWLLAAAAPGSRRGSRRAERRRAFDTDLRLVDAAGAAAPKKPHASFFTGSREKGGGAGMVKVISAGMELRHQRAARGRRLEPPTP